MKKKLFSLVMAVAMVLSLAVPAFATNWHAWESESAVNEQQVVFVAKTFVPTIKITMPKIETNPVILNPYKIGFTVSTDGNKLNGQAITVNDNTRQVICPVYLIKNETDVDMNFAIKATSTVGGALNLQSSHVAITDTNKDALIQLAVSKTSTEMTSTALSAAMSTGLIGTGLDPYDTVNNEVLTLASGDVETSAASLGTRTLAKKGTDATYLKMQFSGELSRNPSTAWAADDTLSTTVVFTFTPISAPDFTSTVVAQSVVFAEASIQDLSFNLPTMTAAGVVDGKDIFKTGTTPATVPVADATNPVAFTVNPTTPAWQVVSGEAVGASVSTGAAPALKLSKDALKKLPTDSNSYDYHVILSYADKNSVPRTLDVKIPITRASA